MEKITFSRTEITEDKLMLMARTSELVKQLNSLTLADFAKKQEIVKDLFGSVGSNPFVGDNFHCDFGKNIHVGDNFHADYNVWIGKFFASSSINAARNMVVENIVQTR